MLAVREEVIDGDSVAVEEGDSVWEEGSVGVHVCVGDNVDVGDLVCEEDGVFDGVPVLD